MCKNNEESEIEIMSDADLVNQLEEGKKPGTKTKNFEDLAKELGI